jgi:hypothetical protein
MRSSYKFITLIVILLAHTMTTKAQWGYNTSVNGTLCTLQGDQQNVVSIPDGSGGTIFAWEDSRFSQRMIYAQRFDASGYPKWTKDGIPVASSTVLEFNPVIITDGRGGALIAFTIGNANNNDVCIQRIDSSGNKKWGSSGIVISSSTIEDDAQVMCSDGMGGAFIVWTNYKVGQNNTTNDLYGQYVDSTGLEKWSSGGIVINNQSGAQVQPTVCQAPSGGCYVAWQDLKKKGSAQDIYIQWLTATAKQMYAKTGIKLSPASIEAYPSLCIDGTGGAFLVWAHQPATGNATIYAMRIDSTATPKWGATAICASGDNTQMPVLKYLGNGAAMIGWMDDRTGSATTSDVYAQKIDLNGVLWQAEGMPVCVAPDYQNTVALDNDGNGGAYFVWTDHRAGGDFSACDIYAQRINSDGSPAWKVDGIPVCTAPQGQDKATVVGIPGFGMVAAWEDYRVSVSNLNLYIQNIFMNGKIPATPPPVLARSTKNVNFPIVNIGVKKDTTITISNTGGDTLRIASVASSNPIFSSTLQTRNIASGTIVKDTLRFKPTASGYQEGYLLFTSNAATSPDTIYVSGTGFGSAKLTLSVKTISFGKVLLGKSKDALLTTQSTGTDTLKIIAATSNDPAFQTTMTPGTILPAKSETDTMRFVPKQLGPISGLFIISSNAMSGKDTVKVSGTGYGVPATQIDKVNIPFGSTEIQKSVSASFTISNSGNDTLVLQSVLSSNPVFSVKNIQQFLLPGKTVNDTIVFAPVAVGTEQGAITILTNAATSPDTIHVTGTGSPKVAIDQTPLIGKDFELGQNYPNPFSSETVIPLRIERAGFVRLTVYSVLGEEITTLVSSLLPAGMHEFRWSPQQGQAGIFYYRLQFNSASSVKLLIVAR